MLGVAASQLPPDARAADVPGWNSGAMIAAVLEIEARFGFEMTSAELETLTGLADLIAVTRARLPPAAASR